jgi:hypothetical protein
MDSRDPSHFLRLPRELRNEVFFDLFFADIEFHTPSSGRKVQIVTLCPTDLDTNPFPVSVFRTCRQLHQEGLDALYPKIKFDLRSNRLNILRKLGPDICSRIRHLALSNLDLTDSVASQMPICEWKTLIAFIAKYCTSLQSLELNLYLAEVSSNEVLWKEFSMDSEWVQALLRICNLEGFQMRITSSNEEYHQDRCIYFNQIYPWLKAELTSSTEQRSAAAPASVLNEAGSPFSFLRLPLSIQQVIIREAVLPQSRVVHPCLSPSTVDGTTTLLPLLLTCRAIQQETEKILYEEAIFSSCHVSYTKDFKSFLRSRSARQKTLMRRIFFKDLDRWIDRSFVKWKSREFPNLRDLEEVMRWHLDHPCIYVFR